MKIAVFYHCWLNHGKAIDLVIEQMEALKRSGILNHPARLFIGLNGNESDETVLRCFVPESAEIFRNPTETWESGEVPTIRMLDGMIDQWPETYVLYFHSKCASRIGMKSCHNWRRCLERHVIAAWQRCVSDLNRGYDTVGAHWHGPHNSNSPTGLSYWAGNFWWARSGFLKTLPEIQTQGQLMFGRYEAEVWIGRSPKAPKILDYTGVTIWKCRH